MFSLRNHWKMSDMEDKILKEDHGQSAAGKDKDENKPNTKLRKNIDSIVSIYLIYLQELCTIS